MIGEANKVWKGFFRKWWRRNEKLLASARKNKSCRPEMRDELITKKETWMNRSGEIFQINSEFLSFNFQWKKVMSTGDLVKLWMLNSKLWIKMSCRPEMRDELITKKETWPNRSGEIFEVKWERRNEKWSKNVMSTGDEKWTNHKD